jgi:hypothetical protein
MKSIFGPVCKVFLGVVVIIDDRFVEVHVLPLVDVEILEFAVFLANPHLVSLVVVETLPHPEYRQMYKLRPACNWRRSSITL